MIKTIAPIFILKTRSFWLGIFPLLLTVLDTFFTSLSASGDGGLLVQTLAQLLSYDPSEIRGVLLAVTPLWGLIIAQQRGGFGGRSPCPTRWSLKRRSRSWRLSRMARLRSKLAWRLEKPSRPGCNSAALF